MKKSFFYRIFSGYLILIVSLTILIVALSYNSLRKQFVETQIVNLQDLNTSLSVLLLSDKEQSRSDLDQLIKSLGTEIQARITIIDTTGKVLADSESDPRTMKNHRRRPEIEQALRGNISHTQRFSTTVEENMLYVASPLVRNGQTVAVVRTSIYLSHLNDIFKPILNRIIKIAILIIIIALSAAFLLARYYSKPVNQLVTAARQIAQGKLDTRVNIKTSDEFAELADSFNAMTVELNRLLADVARQRDELQTIIAAVPSGLLVLANDGRVAFYNREFQKITEREELRDKFYWEVLRQPQFTEFIKDLQANRGNRTQEIVINSKTYLCSATAETTGGEIVLIFSDISELKAVQKMKRDFVVNVSHELRTPLTAIKGFVETLLEETSGNEQRYLTIIARHTDRLINIVNDLLTLAEIEEKSQLEYETISLSNLINDTLKIFEERLQAKNLKVAVEIASDLTTIKVDPFKFQQVLINLLDNAIKYTEKGQITIRAQKKADQVQITIQDTGCGIPPEHLPRIFERFYVVDKARSRQMGGTGLGLAIAKHIVLLHNGNIEVESQPGFGTNFIITLPVYK
ncbi:MAG TPA: ATP-binding protein [Candidatus Marinimicrobia bacterium]|nr:ATP-binding protein [Candidatus Neomarinimicrobiota bacterium]HRS52043.1 ATP-binding protein [Candidatus Neomarinimicrobiota bacterium]HRU91645.1 ATP-binding protein [Candidatus Neomarinimicrobiota bacterium]